MTSPDPPNEQAGITRAYHVPAILRATAATTPGWTRVVRDSRGATAPAALLLERFSVDSAGFHSAPTHLATQVDVPPMGDSITEGSIAAVLKAPGDSVAVDEVIAQIETDKVTIDVRAPAAGVVKDILVAEGDSVNVGRGVGSDVGQLIPPTSSAKLAYPLRDSPCK